MCVRLLIVLIIFTLEFVRDRRNVTDQREVSSRRLFPANFYFLIGINSNNDNIDVNKYDERVRSRLPIVSLAICIYPCPPGRPPFEFRHRHQDWKTKSGSLAFLMRRECFRC